MFASKQLPADGETARPVPRVGSVNHCPHLSWIEWAAIATVSISALGVLAVLAHRFWTYTLDDAYISFRYAQNLLDGDGLVFNAGEFPRSEGITSPLWAFVMASGLAVSIDALLLAKTMGVAAAIFTAVTIVAAVSKILRRTSTLSTRTSCAFGIVAAASFVISPYVVVNSVSGMETSLAVAAYAAFLLRTVGTVELATRRSSAAITGVFAVIVPMLRPEMGLAVVVTLFATLVLWRASRPYIATSLATFVGLGLAYFFVRFAYYGLPLPLPFYIKQGGSAAPGWTDLQGFLKYSVVLGLLSTVAAGFAAYALSRKRGNAMLATLLAISVGAIAQLAYYATIHHIMGFGFRYFMPVLAALTITAGVGAGLVCARITTRTGPQAIAITGFVASLLIPNALALSPTDQLVAWYTEGKPWLQIASDLRDAGAGSLSIAMNDCGLIPYVTKSPVVDLAGLSNRNIALSGDHHAAAVAEVSRSRPDLVLLVASRINDSTSVLGMESLSDDDLRSLGYRLAGSIEAAPSYHYLVYATAAPPVQLVLARMKSDGSMTTA